MPCQKVIWYILPVIRSEIAKAMIEMGLKQNEIAKKLGITESAISQYLKGKRGYFKFPEIVQTKIKLAVKKIIEDNGGEFEIRKELCKICKFIQNEEICGNFNK